VVAARTRWMRWGVGAGSCIVCCCAVKDLHGRVRGSWISHGCLELDCVDVWIMKARRGCV